MGSALAALVKRLAKMVDMSWHDGWEEQGQVAHKWFEAQYGPAQAVS